MAIQISYTSPQIQTLLDQAGTALQASDIDTTLSLSGKAAEAAATGNRINSVNSSLSARITSAEATIRGLQSTVNTMVDPTLSVDGKAADARQTGQAVRSLAQRMLLEDRDTGDKYQIKWVITNGHPAVELTKEAG